jgi:Flp pilus assembly pilin Flp
MIKKNKKGAALVEYGLLVGLVSVISVLSVLSLAKIIRFDYLVTALHMYEISNTLDNYFSNGDFDDPSGMSPTAWGYLSPTLMGWTSNNGRNFELHKSGWQGVFSVNGDYWLDTNASPGHMDISQSITNLHSAAPYRLTLWAGDRDSDLDGEAEVYWNGSLIGTLNPTEEDLMQEFKFIVESLEGANKTNTIRILDTGDNDSNGLSLDQVRLFGR